MSVQSLRFPVLCGPTAGGKTAAAVALAHALAARGIPAEIVTADAFQVYRGMDIGTAKPTIAEREGVPHHLIDIVDPRERFTVDQWLTRAEAVIAECRSRGVVPIVVGGTHLYIKALMDGLFEGPSADAALRETLGAMDPAARRAELERVDPAAAARIHFNDERRTIRALEVFRLTGTPISAHQQQWDAASRNDAKLFALQWPTDALNRRINARVKQMMESGLLDEVRRLRDADAFGPTSREALGYKQLLGHLDESSQTHGESEFKGRREPTPHPLPRGGGEEDHGRRESQKLSDVIEHIKIDTRRFAKNQRTWLKRLGINTESVSIDAEGKSASEIAQVVANTILSG